MHENTIWKIRKEEAHLPSSLPGRKTWRTSSEAEENNLWHSEASPLRLYSIFSYSRRRSNGAMRPLPKWKKLLSLSYHANAKYEEERRRKEEEEQRRWGREEPERTLEKLERQRTKKKTCEEAAREKNARQTPQQARKSNLLSAYSSDLLVCGAAYNGLWRREQRALSEEKIKPEEEERVKKEKRMKRASEIISHKKRWRESNLEMKYRENYIRNCVAEETFWSCPLQERKSRRRRRQLSWRRKSDMLKAKAMEALFCEENCDWLTQERWNGSLEKRLAWTAKWRKWNGRLKEPSISVELRRERSQLKTRQCGCLSQAERRREIESYLSVLRKLRAKSLPQPLLRPESWKPPALQPLEGGGGLWKWPNTTARNEESWPSALQPGRAACGLQPACHFFYLLHVSCCLSPAQKCWQLAEAKLCWARGRLSELCSHGEETSPSWRQHSWSLSWRWRLTASCQWLSSERKATGGRRREEGDSRKAGYRRKASTEKKLEEEKKRNERRERKKETYKLWRKYRRRRYREKISGKEDYEKILCIPQWRREGKSGQPQWRK